MFQAVASGLILAAISGITFIAYRHPEAYEKIYAPFSVITLIAFVAIAAWTLGVDYAYIALIKFVDPTRLDQATQATNALLPSSLVFTVSMFGINFYMIFLRQLHRLVGEKK